MVMQDSLYLQKAHECLAGAESAFINHRYNNCANRAYYACFQAGIAALLAAGVRPGGDQWSHSFVPTQFDGLLIYRRKLYPTELRGIIERNYDLRAKADYDEDFVSRAEAERIMRRTRLFVETVTRGGGTQ
jgi:uncharacterized protein (UPF0332 family)